MILQELQSAVDSLLETEQGKFLLSDLDPRASKAQIARIEKSTGVRLPAKYVAFLTSFGGGRVGYCGIFSANSASSYYFPKQFLKLAEHLPEGWIPFSDDGCGGIYVLRSGLSSEDESVYYWDHETRKVTESEFEDIYQFVLHTGLESSSDRRLRETGRDSRGRPLS